MNRRHLYFGSAALVAGILLLGAGYWLGRASRPHEEIAPATHKTSYVIHEYNWRYRSNHTPHHQDDGRPGKPVKVFGDRTQADAYCLQLNLQKRKEVNPFRFMPAPGGGGCLDQYTSKGEAGFLALLRAEGLTPSAEALKPGYEVDQAWAWSDWCEENLGKWDAGLVDRLWNALDLLSFYEVIEVPGEP